MISNITLEKLLKDKKITTNTFQKVKIAQNYIEKKYWMKKINEEEKRREWDYITSKFRDLNLTDKDSTNIKKAIQSKDLVKSRLKRKKMNVKEFDPLAIIGRGAFGEVRLCKYRETGEIFAVKKMKKSEMKLKNQIISITAEKELLVEAKNNWIVCLNFSFQDDEFLYLVMEYLHGGDLMNLLIIKNIFTEDEARFYAAELVLAIEYVHKLNYIHRDIKPDNVLIDKYGHLKLSDFGLSKKMVLINPKQDIHLSNDLSSNLISKQNNFNQTLNHKNKRNLAFSTVGSPDYIAPEVFSNNGYGHEADWWSLGIIIYEMLVGYAPFTSDSPKNIYKKIINFKTFLKFPNDSILSPEAIDLISKLLTDQEKRLGNNGAEEIKRHPFFKQIDWENLRQMTPPFIPEVITLINKISCDTDTKYFDDIKEENPFYPVKLPTKRMRKDTDFINFTYKREIINKSNVEFALDIIESMKMKCATENKLENMTLHNSITITETASANNSIENSNQVISSAGIMNESGLESNKEIHRKGIKKNIINNIKTPYQAIANCFARLSSTKMKESSINNNKKPINNCITKLKINPQKTVNYLKEAKIDLKRSISNEKKNKINNNEIPLNIEPKIEKNKNILSKYNPYNSNAFKKINIDLSDIHGEKINYKKPLTELKERNNIIISSQKPSIRKSSNNDKIKSNSILQSFNKQSSVSKPVKTNRIITKLTKPNTKLIK